MNEQNHLDESKDDSLNNSAQEKMSSAGSEKVAGEDKQQEAPQEGNGPVDEATDDSKKGEDVDDNASPRVILNELEKEAEEKKGEDAVIEKSEVAPKTASETTEKKPEEEKRGEETPEEKSEEILSDAMKQLDGLLQEIKSEAPLDQGEQTPS